jgi:hypothetical protein
MATIFSTIEGVVKNINSENYAIWGQQHLTGLSRLNSQRQHLFIAIAEVEDETFIYVGTFGFLSVAAGFNNSNGRKHKISYNHNNHKAFDNLSNHHDNYSTYDYYHEAFENQSKN